MDGSIIFLVMVIVLFVVLIGSIFVWLILSKNSCFPFKRGGFGPDNGYDQPRIEIIKKKGKTK